jgi:hypothetical protein
MKTEDKPTVALDAIAELVRRDKELQRQQSALKKERDKVREQVARLMGDALVGTVAGEPAFTYEYTSAWRTAEFMKENEDLARFFVFKKEVEVLDEELLHRLHPQLWERYRSRTLKMVAGWGDGPEGS